MKLKIWIVGASSGIGFELLKRWLMEGHLLIASSRSATTSTNLIDLQKKYPHQLVLIDVDVSSDEGIASCVERVWNAYGGIHRWFYNAGAYEVMRSSKWSVEHFEAMNQTNYMGAVRIMIPLHQKCSGQQKCEWVWNASLSSYFGLPYGGAYSAPKAALVNLAESIQPELKLEGITLRIINHGFVKTRLTSKNDFEMPQLMEPITAANRIADALERENGFEIRFPKVLGGFLSLLRHLPYRLSLWLSAKALR